MPDTPAPSQPNTVASKPVQQAGPPSPPPIAQHPAVKTPVGKKSFGRKHSGVLLITRTQLFMYVEGKADVVVYSFTPDVVRDLDIINQDLLHEKISALLMQQQVPPANFFVLLSNQTLFSKQLIATDVSQKKVEEEKFLNTIPFETPSVKNITLGPNTYIVVANEQLFSAFEEVFEKEGSEFLLVLPEFLFAKELNLAQGLSAPSAQILLKKMQEFKVFSFVKKDLPEDSQSGGGEDKKFKLQVSGGKSNRRFVIGGVLAMLVGILLAAFLYIQQTKPVQPPPPPATSDVVPESVIPTEIPEGAPASDAAEFATPSAVVEGDTSSDITLQYTEQNTYTAEVIAGRLRLLGFGSIVMQRVSMTGSAPQIIFRPTVSEAVERLLVSELKKRYGEIILRESSVAVNDIVVFIGNNPDD
jgi:hypothetical protein